MITIRLIGGAKKAIGKPAVGFDRANASILEILEFLKSIALEPRLLQPNNLIITLNGVDCASLQRYKTMVNNGDIVTIVPVVHGGIDYVLDGYHMFIAGIQRIKQDPGELIDTLRAEYDNASIQAVNAVSVFGQEHVRGIVRIVLELEKRKIMLTNRRETELLVRLAGTAQISEAIRRVGLKKDTAGCFIAFSDNRESLYQFQIGIKIQFELNELVLRPDKKKKAWLASMLGLTTKLNDGEFLQYLLEKAAIMVQ
jgi:tRNA threonylcarbamoyladenosine modification (KEOPS) complex Cgi121 subunit/molybdopterin converting factor small subunit